MEDASNFIAQGLVVLINPLPQNQNMNSRTVDPSGAYGGTPNPSDTATGHGCINMVNGTNAVMF